MQPPGNAVDAVTDTRRELLRPQLVRLRQQTIDHPTATDARTVLCGQRSMRLSASEWASIIQAFKEVGTGRNCCHLLAESVALEMRSAERGVSVEDLGLGLALARDLTAARRGLLQAGSNDRAELVDQANARLERLLKYLQGELKPADVHRAQMLSDLYPQETGSLLAVRGATPAKKVPRAVAPASVSARAVDSSAPRRWRAWGVVALCAVVALLLANTLRSDKVPSQLTRKDFADLPAVVNVKPRGPVLYVTLKLSRWKALDPDDRRSFLARITEKANDAGFDQAQFSTDDDKLVARWAKGEDAELF